VDAVSNDSAYTGGQLWGMYGDQTSPANQFGSQAGEAWAAGHTGSTKVVVGVIDSGIDYTHQDLYLNVWLNQGEISAALKSVLVDTDGDRLITFRDLNDAANAASVSDLNGNGRIDAGDLLADARWENGTDQDGNGFVDDLVGWDFANDDNDPFDDNEHGTHVAGHDRRRRRQRHGRRGRQLGRPGDGTKVPDRHRLGFDRRRDRRDRLLHQDGAGLDSGQDFALTNNSWGGGGFSQAVLDAIIAGARQDILFVAAAAMAGAMGSATIMTASLIIRPTTRPKPLPDMRR
jgi:subtilisin family serine protease